jgi:amino acid transporter
MKWWSWLIVLSSVILGIGISFLVGFLTINTTKMPNWQGVVWTSLIITVLLLIIILSLGYTRNQWALEFWNDRVRRYQKTYEDNEAKILHIRNIIIFISLMMAIFTIVASIVFF